MIDEVLTPDSSRFWAGREYAPREEASRASTNSLSGTISDPELGQDDPRTPLPAEVVAGRRRSTRGLSKLTGKFCRNPISSSANRDRAASVATSRFHSTNPVLMPGDETPMHFSQPAPATCV